MYLSHYGLSKKPFDISPDPRFLWLGEKHREALSYLKYGIMENKGFLMITGDVGTGKTALIKRLTRLIDAATFVVTVPDPDMTKLDFFNFLADELNMNRTFSSKGEFLIHFKHFLKDAYSEHRKVLLIIDESQRLNHELLQEIRLLANIDLGGQVLLNIFFVGQTEFNEILKEERNRTVRQRITASFHLDPLNAAEVKNYIVHRLRIAGATSQIFTDEAMQRVFEITSGYPRLINILCDHALMTGYSSEMTAIVPSMVDECANELSITFGNHVAPAVITNKLESEPILAAEIEPALFSAPDLESEDMSTVSTEEVVKQMAQEAASRRNILRPLALAIAVLFMLFGITYFTFGPVRNYIADSSQAESDPPPLTTFKSEVADVKKTEPSSATDKVQDTVIAAKPSTTEVPSSFKTSNDTLESKTAKMAAVGNPPDKSKEQVIEDNVQNVTQSDDPKAALNQGSEDKSGASSKAESEVPAAVAAVDDKGISPESNATVKDQPAVAVAPQKAVIFFEHDSIEMSSEAQKELARLVSAVFRLPKSLISIQGFTDSLGNEWYNRKLSQTRADIVRDYLVTRGVDPNLIRSVGRGSEDPIDDNSTRDGRKRNRRVEIEVEVPSSG